MIKKLLKYIKGYRVYSLLAPLTIIGEVMLEVRIPMLMADIVDVGINGGAGVDYILSKGLQMVLMALASLLCGALSARFASVAGMGFGANIRAELFGKVQDFSFANIDKFSTASLVTRLTTDINTVQNTYMMLIRVCVRSPIMFIMAIIYAIKFSARLSTVFAVVVPVLVVALAIIMTHAFPLFKQMFRRYDDLNATVQEDLIAVRVVKAFVRSDYEKQRFKKSNDALMSASVAAERLVIINNPIMMLCVYVCIIAVLWFGGGYVIEGSMQTGELMGFVTYINQIMMSLMMISMMLVMLVTSKAAVSRIIEVIDEKPDINDDCADPELEVADGSIDMNGVCFKYNINAEKNVLDNIDLHIKSGETVGILGGTGSAKTTLVQLIPRLYDVSSGELLVGGRNVKDYKIKTLRDSVSMVLQSNVLFSGTIADNLRWGDEDATQEELENACKIAQAHDFVMSLPDGYNTDLGQGGVNLSGGQKQRLCIARALLKKPKILILDDSTSAVDTATDAKIRDGFKENLGSVTTIIIAQRVSSISHADKIVVLDDGKINAVGTHEELLQNNEIYREVYTSQQEGSVA
ncbi:MAG: ABC transporter ATP-binding protein [Acutalibacteraceae bacterium]